MTSRQCHDVMTSLCSHNVFLYKNKNDKIKIDIRDGKKY
jgi:hypothetical protein